MKKNFTKNLVLSLAVAVISHGTMAQNLANLLSNSAFDLGSDSWNITGMYAEINTENIYGGRIAGNRVAEIDAQAGLRQKLEAIPGKIYSLSYKASRRTTGNTPAIVGITLRIVGNTTGTVYYSNNTSYANTSFGYVAETRSFSVPANSADQIMLIEMVAYNNNSTHGVIVDDVQMTMSSPASLPVQWNSFTAEVRNQQAILAWKTAAELNNKHFVIERSVNGNSYDSIGTVAANASHQYGFTDAALINGTSFYRLRQVDIDGGSKYSKIVTVRTQAGTNELKLFPTVAHSVVNFAVRSEGKTDATVLVFDAGGRLVMQLQRSLGTGVNQQSIDVTSLNEGTYYFSIRNSAGTINISKSFYKAS